MEDNLFNEMSQLNCLLKKHKQLQQRSAFKSFYQSEGREKTAYTFENTNNYSNACNYEKQKPQSTIMNKVYVNPNYKCKNNVIHVNPHVQVKPSIYINPKLIKNIATTQNQERETRNCFQSNQLDTHSDQQNKVSVHVNPKLMTKLIKDVPKQSDNNISNLLNIKNTSSSFPVKQTMLDSLSNNKNDKYISSVSSNKKISTTYAIPNERRLSTNFKINSKTKLVNNIGNFGKNANSSLVLLSQRKLVRIKKSPKFIATSTVGAKLLPVSKTKIIYCGSKKLKFSKKNLINTMNHLKNVNHVKLVRNIDKSKTNWYNKYDKTVSILCKKKKISPKKIINNSVGLVSIGGIMYKTSRNQLVRSNSNTSSLKRKRTIIPNKHCQYYTTKNGKKLLKIDVNKTKICNSGVKANTSISCVKNYKTNISNKMKQRSLQILRNKMRKNNQPCLLFQRFGYCANQLAKTCPKVHDKKQVALCKNFLQGKCFLDNCQLSHNVGPEKMPTCKYFLDGCCIRDGCPYLHVKVSSKNPICVEFLRGYCSQGNECQKRHIYACPEFDKSGKCTKGKFCQYPHKSHLSEVKRLKITPCNKKNEESNNKSEVISLKFKATECRKRYYDNTSEEFNQKRAKLSKLVTILKDIHTVQENSSRKDKSIVKEIFDDSINCEKNFETYKKQKTPIGSLPAYIPIN